MFVLHFHQLKNPKMSKLLFALLCTATLPLASIAQSAHARHTHGPRLHGPHAPASASRTSPEIHSNKWAAKTTATSSRLISYVSFEHDGSSFIPYDSASVTYTGTRGGRYNPLWEEWEWYFDNANTQLYNNATSSYDPPVNRSSQTFDTDNNPTTSLSEEWAAHLSAWRNAYVSNYTYDAAGNRLTGIDQYWDTTTSAWVNMFRETTTYTAANKVATNTNDIWDLATSSWGSTGRITNTYDAANNLTVELNEYWSSSSSSWVNGSRANHTYNAANNKTTTLYYSWNSTSATWDTSGRISYTYDASDRLIESTYENYNVSISSWEPGSKSLFSSFDGNNPQTIIMQSWDGGTMTYENSERENYTYNSDGFITYFYNQEYDYITGSWASTSFSYAERLRYEPYSTVSIAKTSNPSINLSVYPVPATNTITVDATGTSSQQYTITIADVAGRLYNTYSTSGQQNIHQTISVAHLQPGSYLLTLHTPSGNSVRQFTITR